MSRAPGGCQVDASSAFGHVVLSCEHATAAVTGRWAVALRAALSAAETNALQQALASHAGVDFGALQLARQLARSMQTPLHAATQSRLLIDCNRSLHHPRLFSTFSKQLDLATRAALVAQLYLPHRRKVAQAVARAIARQRRAVHLGVHSFTPVLQGCVRAFEVGILYDPARPQEKALAERLLQHLRAVLPQLRIRRNAPYRGVADGLTTALRRRHQDGRYQGVELEISQAVTMQDASAWARQRKLLATAIVAAVTR